MDIRAAFYRVCTISTDRKLYFCIYSNWQSVYCIVGWTDCTGCGKNRGDQEAHTELWLDTSAAFPLSLLLYSHYPWCCIPIIPAVDVFPLSLLLYSHYPCCWCIPIIPAAVFPLSLLLYSHYPCCWCIPIIPAAVFPLSLLLYSHYPCWCIPIIPSAVVL